MVFYNLVIIFLFFGFIKNEKLAPIDSQEPYIEGDRSINSTRGKLVSMRCIVHNVKNYKIAWYFNGILLSLNNIRIKDDKRYSVENPQPNEWKLIINPVESHNDGIYSCRLTNGMKNEIVLKVGVPPIFIGNNQSHVIINASEKENITLSCEAEGNPEPTIYWYKNNKLIATGPQLIRKDITRHSHLDYECVARNGIEPDSSRIFKINVNFKPSLNVMYHLKEYNNKKDVNSDLSDGELQIVCEITGNPVNSINWFKDGFKIKDDSQARYLAHRSSSSFIHSPSKSTLSSNHNNTKRKKTITIHSTQTNNHKYISKLRIKNFDNSDNGIYKCSVNGFEGDLAKSVTINEIAVRPNSENEIEYSISPSAKNTNEVKNSKQTIDQKDNFSNKLIENNNLMHDRVRGARYNNKTKVLPTTYENYENFNFKFSFNFYLSIILIILNLVIKF